MLKKYTWRKVSVVLKEFLFRSCRQPGCPQEEVKRTREGGGGSWCSQKRGERGNCRKDKVSRSFLKEVDFGCCRRAKRGRGSFFSGNGGEEDKKANYRTTYGGCCEKGGKEGGNLMLPLQFAIDWTRKIIPTKCTIF